MKLRPQYRKESVAFVKQITKAMTRFIQRSYPDFPLPKIAWVDDPFASGALGGLENNRPWMKLNIAYAYKYNNFPEYKEFSTNPIYGTIVFGGLNWKKYLAALVAHEIAHCVYFYTENKGWSIPSQLDQYATIPHKSSSIGHGYRWQRIYAQLRIEFVNSKYDDNIMSEDTVIDYFEGKL